MHISGLNPLLLLCQPCAGTIKASRKRVAFPRAASPLQPGQRLHLWHCCAACWQSNDCTTAAILTRQLQLQKSLWNEAPEKSIVNRCNLMKAVKNTNKGTLASVQGAEQADAT